MRRQRRLILAAVAAAVTVLVSVLPGTAVAARAAGAQAKVANILAAYGGEIREAQPRADGYRHVDTDATLDKLAELHNTTFVNLIWDAPSDWDDFRTELLPAAQQRGLDAWVYLVPPTECSAERCSYPFKTDYLRWAQEIATLSKQYPALKGYAIDDFNHNLDLFTPDYVRQMQDTAKSINPDLVFLPQVYNQTVTTAFVDSYGPIIDGLILAYRDDPYRNTQRTDTLRGQLDAASANLARYGKPLVLMNYTSNLSGTPFPPNPDYVRTTTEIGAEYVAAGKLGGTVTYILPLNPADDWRNDNHAHGGVGRLSLFVPMATPTRPGDEASASQVVQVDPNAPDYRITFRQDDTYYNGGAATGYQFKQLLVDGQPVWEADVATDDLGYTDVQVDLSAQLRGKTSATLTFRLLERKAVTNFWVDARVDDIEAIGFTVTNPGFESRDGWQLAANTPAILPDIEHYLVDRADQAFAAVQGVYGPARLVLEARDSGRQGLVAVAEQAWAQQRAGRPQAAGALARAYAAQARGLRLPALAELGDQVAGELAG
ncbi:MULTISPECIES: hypothetical protein [Amycolatopsis]|uniref:Uncharacterized protein n=1 Tax=Amycolatopsis dongchuanensis TaxID=1070866 RepID=A0ABP9PTS5_9PSEU